MLCCVSSPRHRSGLEEAASPRDREKEKVGIASQSPFHLATLEQSFFRDYPVMGRELGYFLVASRKGE